MIGHCVLCGKEDYLSFGVCRHCTHGAKNFGRALEALSYIAFCDPLASTSATGDEDVTSLVDELEEVT